jgi:hypothetical protein
MNELTKRSRIAVRWSTSPDDMGYGNKPAPHVLTGKPAYIGSPRTALEYAYGVQRKVGFGTFLRVEYRHNGTVLQQGRDLLTRIVFDR